MAMLDSDRRGHLWGPRQAHFGVVPEESSTIWLWVRPDLACVYADFALRYDHPRNDPSLPWDETGWSGWITFDGLTECTWLAGLRISIPSILSSTAEGCFQSTMSGSESLEDGTILDLGIGELQVRCQRMDLELDAVAHGQPGPVPVPADLAPLPPPLLGADAEDLLPLLVRGGIPLDSTPLGEVAVLDRTDTIARLSWNRRPEPEIFESISFNGQEVRDLHWHEVRICPDPTGRFPPWEPRLHGLRRLGTRYAAWGPWGSVEWTAAGFEIRTRRGRGH